MEGPRRWKEELGLLSSQALFYYYGFQSSLGYSFPLRIIAQVLCNPFSSLQLVDEMVFYVGLFVSVILPVKFFRNSFCSFYIAFHISLSLFLFYF